MFLRITKKSLFLFFAILLLSSCGKEININGNIEGDDFDGETVYLYVVKSDSLTIPSFVAKTTVEDGCFAFHAIEKYIEEKELPTIAILSLFDLFDQTETRDLPIATAILEEGTVHVTFSGTAVILSGTAKNEKFNLIHQAITDLADLAERKDRFGDIDNIPADDKGRDGRGQLQFLDQRLKDVTFDFAKENMTNNMGQFLFYSYAENMFTPAQMIELIALSDAKFKDRKEIKELSNILATMNNDSPALNIEHTEPSLEIDVEK